jgi:hypothetical protein
VGRSKEQTSNRDLDALSLRPSRTSPIAAEKAKSIPDLRPVTAASLSNTDQVRAVLRSSRSPRAMTRAH